MSNLAKLSLMLLASVFCFPCDASEPIVEHFMGQIRPTEIVSFNTTVDLNTSELSFVLVWENTTSSLDAVLYSPSGMEINSSAQPPVIYNKNMTLVYYVIYSPEPGEWVAKVRANAVPDIGESYWVIFDTAAASEEVVTEEIPANGLEGEPEECEECNE